MNDIELRWRVVVVPGPTNFYQGMPPQNYHRILQYRERMSQLGQPPWTEWKDVREFYDVWQPETQEAGHGKG